MPDIDLEAWERAARRALKLFRAAELSDEQLAACGLTRGAAAVIDRAIDRVLAAALALTDLQLSLLPELARHLVERTRAAESLVVNLVTILIDRGILSTEDRGAVKTLTDEQAAARAVDGVFDPRAEDAVKAIRTLLARIGPGK